jgi:hypothetical protein
MNDLEIEMLAADLSRRGHDRDWIIYYICREHELQWKDVAPTVDHVIGTMASRGGLNLFGWRSILLLAGLVIGGGLVLTAGLEAAGFARVAVPEGGLWAVIQQAGALIVSTPRLWSQLILGGILFSYCLGRLLVVFSHLMAAGNHNEPD